MQRLLTVTLICERKKAFYACKPVKRLKITVIRKIAWPLHFQIYSYPMQDFCKYELPALIDLLAKETSNYTKMIAAGITNGEDYNRVKIQINKIQAAIFWKKQKERLFFNRWSDGNDLVYSF